MEETDGTGAKTSRKRRTPHGKIGFESLGKKIGHNWQNLDAISIARYRKLSDLDMGRYRAEMEEWNAQNGAQQDTEGRLLSAHTASSGPVEAPDARRAAPLLLQQRRSDTLELAQDQYAAAMASLDTEMRLIEASRASLLNGLPRASGGNSFTAANNLETLLQAPYNGALQHGTASATVTSSSSYGPDALFCPASHPQVLGVPSGEARALSNLMSYQNCVQTPMGQIDTFPLLGLHGLGHLPGANSLHNPFPSPYAGYPRHALEDMRGAGAFEDVRGAGMNGAREYRAGMNDAIADYRQQK